MENVKKVDLLSIAQSQRMAADFCFVHKWLSYSGVVMFGKINASVFKNKCTGTASGSQLNNTRWGEKEKSDYFACLCNSTRQPFLWEKGIKIHNTA